MKDLKKERGEPLTLTVTIPAKAKPLFLAVSELYPGMDREEFAAKAVCKFLTSEEVSDQFDRLVSDLL